MPINTFTSYIIFINNTFDINYIIIKNSTIENNFGASVVINENSDVNFPLNNTIADDANIDLLLDATSNNILNNGFGNVVDLGCNS
jgi:hypothetical protein